MSKKRASRGSGGRSRRALGLTGSLALCVALTGLVAACDPGVSSRSGAVGQGVRSSPANGDASSIEAPHGVNDAGPFRVVVVGSDFTEPAYLELRLADEVVRAAAVTVSSSRVEAAVPALGAAGRWEVRVGAGDAAPSQPLIAGPPLHLDVALAARTDGVGQLVHARTDHEAVKLQSGEVLIVGGLRRHSSGGAFSVGAVELYDPQADRFTVVGELQFARTGHRAVRLASGRVLVAGGLITPLGAPTLRWGQPAGGLPVEVYDPATQALHTLPLQVDQRGFVLVPLDGERALLAGGFDGAGDPASAAYVIDGNTGAATPVPAPNDPRYEPAAVRLPGGEVALFGGYDAAMVSGRSVWTTFDTGELYDPVTQSWRTLPGVLSSPVTHDAFVTPDAAGSGWEVAIVGSPRASWLTGAGSLDVWQPGAASFATEPLAPLNVNFRFAVLGGRELLAVGEWMAALHERPGARTTQLAARRQGGHTVTPLDSDTALVAGGDYFGIADAELVRRPGAPASGGGSGGQAGAGTWSSVPIQSPTGRGVSLYDEDLSLADDTIVYVLDTSDSMDRASGHFTDLDGNLSTGTRLDRAKIELIRSIRSLDEGVRFNVIAYECDIFEWESDLQAADQAAKASAEAWIQAQGAWGGTGTGPAVARALADPDVTTVVLLSNGAPNCGANGSAGHRNMILQANTQGARIHVLGFGAGAFLGSFLRSIADATGGNFYAVSS